MKLPQLMALAALIWLGITLVVHASLKNSPSLAFLSNGGLGPMQPASEALELCTKVQSPMRRAYCFSDLASTNDARVARKFATMILTSEAEKGSWQFHDAAIACALAVDIPSCVHDVLASENVTKAAEFPKKPLPFRNKIGTVIMEDVHHEFTDEDAQKACEGVKNTVERIYCEKHFTRLDDEDTAKHYIHLSMDQTELAAKHGRKKDPDCKNNTLEDAQVLCASTPFRYYEPCLNQVQLLPNDHVAFHFVQLFKMPFDATPGVELIEKLCNHVPQKRRHACIQHLNNLQGPEASAAHYLRFYFDNKAPLPAQAQQRQRLNPAQAKQICDFEGKGSSAKMQNECQRDILTMNSVGAAQIYAGMFFKQRQSLRAAG